MKVRTLKVAIAVTCATAVSLPVFAQDTDASQSSNKKQAVEQKQITATRLQTVVVTGTRAFGRTATDSLSPIDVLTPAELAATGAPNLIGALRQLLPSFYSAAMSLSDASVGAMPAALRGLSSNETIVLINGKLQHHSAVSLGSGADTLGTGFGGSPVDLNAIPINAIASIEVLRDGAAAQYGSSAIAGVINIILKGGAGQHGSAYVKYGQYGGDGRTSEGGVDGGFDIGNRGWVHLSATYLHQDYANRAGPDFRDPGNPMYGKIDWIIGLPQETQKQLAFNMQYDLGENATFYAFGIFNKRNTQNAGAYRTVTGYQETNPAGAKIFPDGFLPFENQGLWDSTAVFGIKGVVAGWDYDFSADLGSSHWKLNTSNTLNFSLGANSPTNFYIGTLAYQNNVFNADFRRNFELGWAGPLTVAGGIQYQDENFVEKAGEPASYLGSGASVFPGFQPSDAISASQGTVAEYIDLEAQLTEKFSAAAAVRHVHNSGFGNDVVGKLSGRFAVSSAFAFRGTVSTGFASPTMQEQFYQTTGNSFIPNGQGVPVQTTVISFRNDNPAAVALGAQPLKPEKSLSYSFGVVYTPQVGPYVTLDAYQITLRNRILSTGALTGPAVEEYLSSVGIPFVQGGSFYTNAVATRTRGVDLIATWPIQLEQSELKLSFGGNWNKTEVLSVAPNPPQLALNGLVLPIVDRAVVGSLTRGTPLTNTSFGAVWTSGRWTVRGQLTRYGQWQALNKYRPSADQTFGARFVPDASISYAVDRWTYTIGGNNFTNTYPAKNIAASSFGGVIRYPISSPFGYVGAFWYARVKYAW